MYRGRLKAPKHLRLGLFRYSAPPPPQHKTAPHNHIRTYPLCLWITQIPVSLLAHPTRHNLAN